MTTRYTRKDLRQDAADYNSRLASAGIDQTFIVAERYEWVAVDLASSEAQQTGAVLRTVESGTPRECVTAMRQEFYNLLK